MNKLDEFFAEYGRYIAPVAFALILTAMALLDMYCIHPNG
jgi:hypothetical protein